MISASRAYQACRDLFDAYPLAVNAVHHIPTMHSMVLMLRDSADARFFVLLRDCGDSRPAYSLIPPLSCPACVSTRPRYSASTSLPSASHFSCSLLSPPRPPSRRRARRLRCPCGVPVYVPGGGGVAGAGLGCCGASWGGRAAGVRAARVLTARCHGPGLGRGSLSRRGACGVAVRADAVEQGREAAADHVAVAAVDRGAGGRRPAWREGRLDGVRRIGIDEKAWRKGHRYITVVIDHDAGRIIWAAEGRNKETLASSSMTSAKNARGC